MPGLGFLAEKQLVLRGIITMERFYALPLWARILSVVAVIAVFFGGAIIWTQNDTQEQEEVTFNNDPSATQAPDAGTVQPSEPAEPSEPSNETTLEPGSEDLPEDYNGELDANEPALNITPEDAANAETVALDGMVAFFTITPGENADQRRDRIAPYVDLNSPMFAENMLGDDLITAQEATVTGSQPLTGDAAKMEYRVQLDVRTQLAADGEEDRPQVLEIRGVYKVTVTKVGDQWLISSYQEA